MTSHPHAIGQSVPRKDARDKVTGAALYTADLRPDDLRFGAVLRSPHHFARIRSIDPSGAQAAPGVIAVITAADIRGAKTFGPIISDQPPLAAGVVRHVGEPVALVVAETRAAALDVLDRIRVDYEPLEPVLDPAAALAPGAPQLFEAGNACAHFLVSEGDLEAAFRRSDVVLEREYSVQRVSPAYLEPETALASWEDGCLAVWTCSQEPFIDRDLIASVLGMPVEKVVVRSATVGGAFGGKEDASLGILAGLAAQRIRGRVLLANARWESFVAHPKRHPGVLSCKIGAARDGTLLGLQVRICLDTGAYSTYGPAVGGLITELAPGPYRTPAVSVETQVAFTNSPPSGAMRGFGSPQALFAIESLMDALAEELKLDPLELRRKNLLRPGDRLVTRLVAGDWAASLPEILAEAGQAARRLEQIPAGAGKRSGVGVALAMQSMGLGAKVPEFSTNAAEWLPDGRVRLALGAPDLGQGLATVAEQILAEALELPVEQIETARLDTSAVFDGGVTCASRMTYLVGNSLLAAAENLKTELLDRASETLRCPRESLAYRAGQVITAAGAAIPAAEIAARLAEDDRPLKAAGRFAFPYPEETTPQHLPVGMPHVLFVFGAHVARVEVDPELGTVQVTDLVAIHDPGRLIHPQAAEGQVQGGAVMGLGYALYEAMPVKPGQGWVQTFAEYLLPTSVDIPRMQTVFLEIPEASGPYGAKGIGEAVTAPTAPAIANAVARATGRRLTHLPIRPEDLIAD
jgi:CO/xanthine dehydrogenase Mo-binding subunit